MPLYGNRMARFGNWLVNNEYSLRFSKSISKTAKGFLLCFVLFGVLFLFCFVFVCLSVFSIHLKSWNEWCSHTKTSKLLRKWEIQNGGSDLAPQLLGEHTILQVLLDRGHDFFWIFFKGVLHPWALFWKTLCIFSKNKATLDKVSFGSGQKYSKELQNHSFTSVETIVVKLQWKMCENQYFPCFEP